MKTKNFVSAVAWWSEERARLEKRILLLALLAVIFSSCKATQLAPSPPVPESEWNRAGVWRQVSDNPATYVPHGLPADASRSASNGQWVKDERDGKCLFVPSGGVAGLREGTLRGEAMKVVGTQAGGDFSPPPSSAWSREPAKATTNALLYAATLPIRPEFWEALGKIAQGVGQSGAGMGGAGCYGAACCR